MLQNCYNRNIFVTIAGGTLAGEVYRQAIYRQAKYIDVRYISRRYNGGRYIGRRGTSPGEGQALRPGSPRRPARRARAGASWKLELGAGSKLELGAEAGLDVRHLKEAVDK